MYSLGSLLENWKRQLTSWAQEGAIRRAAVDALRLEEPKALKELVARWSAGQFQDLPPVVVLPASTMAGAAGAYAISTGTIYLNQEWLQSASEAQAMAVLTEELGHHLDGLLNASDTPGDEGELFAALLDRGGLLSEPERLALQAEDDRGRVLVAGRKLEVEQARVISTPKKPLLRLMTLASRGPEGSQRSTAFTFTVSRTGATTGVSTARWAVSPHGTGTSAVNAADFTGGVFPSGTVSFTSGQTSSTITVNVAGDSTVESSEGFALTLSAPVGATLSPTAFRATGLILNDDSLLSISPLVALRAEGNRGSTLYTFLVSRTGATTGVSTARWSVAGSGANPATTNDFTGGAFPSGTLSFAAGQATRTLTVSVAGDTLWERNETFAVTLSNPSGAILAAATATGTIRNDDLPPPPPPPSLAISSASADKPEGTRSSATLYTFVVSRTGDTTGVSTARWSVAGSGANPATTNDFTGGAFPAGTLSFAAGQTSAALTVSVNADSTVENDKAFSLTLSNPSGAILAAATATGTIRNDDLPPTPPPPTLVNNALVNASLSIPGEIDSYPVDVLTGSILSASLISANPSLWPLIDLKTLEGQLIKSAIAFNENSADLGVVEMITGRAMIQVRTQTGATGEYTLNVSVKSRDDIKNEVFNLTNEERRKAGLQPLLRNNLLDQAAQAHVNDMDASNRYLAHTGSNGSDPVTRIASTGYKGGWVDLGNGQLRGISSENAAFGYTTPAEVVKGWMNSPGHRAAILDPYTKEIGIGFELDNEVGGMPTYWVQNFGHPWMAGMNQWF